MDILIWVYVIGACGAFVAAVKEATIEDVIASMVVALLWPLLLLGMLFKRIGF